MERTMQNKLEALRRSERELISESLNIIRAAIRKHPGRSVRIGNTVLALTPGDIIRFSVNAGPFADFYGDEGWNTAEDIAHWADVVADAELCFNAGLPAYYSDWRDRVKA